MHELSIAQSVITIVESSLPISFSGKITSVSIQVGRLSGIEIDALAFSFSILKEKSKLKNAELNIENVQALAECKNCHRIFEIRAYGDPCPDCLSYSNLIIKGREMKVLNVMID